MNNSVIINLVVYIALFIYIFLNYVNLFFLDFDRLIKIMFYIQLELKNVR
jgi:hypothetical protein